jgi:hypothetical protein
MTTSERAIYAPQGINARRVEAMIIASMPTDTWLTVGQICRLIRKHEDRTRPRLNRLLRDGKIERKRDAGEHSTVYFRRRSSAAALVSQG